MFLKAFICAHVWVTCSFCIVLYFCTWSEAIIKKNIDVCMWQNLIYDHSMLVFSRKHTDIGKHHRELRTSITSCLFMSVSLCRSSQLFKTNYVMSMHDLVRDFKWEHRHVGSLNFAGCCLLPSALPVTTQSHQHFCLTFCCCSNHRLTVCWKKQEAGRLRHGGGDKRKRGEINNLINKSISYVKSGKEGQAHTYTLNYRLFWQTHFSLL